MNIVKYINTSNCLSSYKPLIPGQGLKKLNAVALLGIERFNNAITAKSFSEKLESRVREITKENLYNLSKIRKNISIFNKVFSLDLNNASEGDVDSFSSLQKVYYSDISDHRISSDVIELIASTAAMLSKILIYGAYCYAITQVPFPSESMKLCAYVAGPWWSSSIWADRVVYDFFRSALTDNPAKNNAIYSGELEAGQIQRFFSFKYYEEVNVASKKRRGVFCLCALMVLFFYSSVCLCLQPPVSKVLLEKGRDHLSLVDVLTSRDWLISQDNCELNNDELF